jgi:type III pantothenate kinase
MLLLLDVGNSRLKWSLRESVAQCNVVLGQASIIRDTPIELACALCEGLSDFLGIMSAQNSSEVVEGLDPSDIQLKVALSCVRGADYEEVITMRLRELFSAEVLSAKPMASWHGLQSGYLFPEKLGVDRWLVLMAAWRRRPGAFGVIDAGTTLTFDVVLEDGRHLGGYIVPGRDLLFASLAKRIKTLNISELSFGSGLGKTTAEAIGHGAEEMLGNFCRQQILENSRLYAVKHWYLTGGGAEYLQPWLDNLDHNIEKVEDFVFEGLLAWLQLEVF